MTTSLRYGLMSDPFPLQASPATGDLDTTTLTIVASNPNPDPDNHPVTLQYLSLVIPTGQDPTDLTADDKLDAEAPSDWNPPDKISSPGKVKYVFHPIAGGGQVKGAGLNFVLKNVPLDRQTGTVEIDVIEGSGGDPTQQLLITKFPNGWGEVSLWTDPDPPMLPHDGTVRLNWAGPDSARYSLSYFTPRDGIVIVPSTGQQPALSNKGQYPSQGDPPLQLEQTTTFYLSVEETIAGQTYSAKQQVTVTVEAFKPTINRFTSEFLWENNSADMVLKWDTQNAATCRVTGDPHLLIPSSLDNSYLITPTVKKPLQTTYILTVENDVGTTLSQLTALQWGNVVASALTGAKGMVVSNDDSFLYLMSSQFGTMTKFALASFFTGAPQIAASYQASSDPWNQSNNIVVTPDSPIGLALSADNNFLFVANSNGGICVINAGTLQLITGTAPGFMPTAIASARDGSRIYVAGTLDGWGGGIVTFIPSSNQGIVSLNLNEPSMTSMIYSDPSGGFESRNTPIAIAISPSENRIFAAHSMGAQVTIWEPSVDPNIPLHQVGTLQGVQFTPKAIAFSSDGTRIFLAGDGNQLHVYDYSTLQPAGQPATLGIGATAIASTFDGTRLLVSDGQTSSLIIPSGFTGGVGG